MFNFKLILVALAASATVSSLSTQRMIRTPQSHRDLAARVISIDKNETTTVLPTKRARKSRRSNSRRCQSNSTSSSLSSSVSQTASVAVNIATSSAANETTSSTVEKTTSTTVAKTTTSTTKTTSSTKAVTTSSASTASSTSSSSESYLTGTQSGDGTYYATGLGACGITNSDTDYIVAVSELLFDTYPGYNGANPNDNPVCNKKITASYGGNDVTVTVTDRCTGCSITSLDFSPSAFTQLADESIGRIHDMTWVWVS